MEALRNQIILLISPQAWGKMFISKHHYALELARQGNTVYFLNPPEQQYSGKAGGISIVHSGAHENLFLIEHRLSFPFRVKFHFLGLFHALIRSHVKQILKSIGKPIDLVWSFDLGNLYPFNFFPHHALKVFHPVDEPPNQAALIAARGAQVIFSVTREILDKYQSYPAPKYLIPHGLSEAFLAPAAPSEHPLGPVHFGLSGNLLRVDIDREILLRIIREHPQVVFDCWGSFDISQSNIGGNADPATRDFIAELRRLPNVHLHGSIPVSALAKAIQDMDGFLICYDIQKDQSRGTNYHKIIEFLSTGKVIVSNNVSAYKDMPDLLTMVDERENNKELPDLFTRVLADLESFNAPELQQKRMEFARQNSYRQQVRRIEAILIGFSDQMGKSREKDGHEKA